MNFIIVSNYYFPETGAAPNRIMNLAEGLAAKNNDVEVICPMPNYPKGRIFEDYKGKFKSKEKLNKITVNRYWIYPSVSKNLIVRTISMVSFAISFWAFIFNRQRIRTTEWVIIQSPPLLVSFSAIILFRKIFRKKIALNISDIWPLSALELGAIKRGRFYNLLEWIERFNYRNSDLHIGQSQEILQHVAQIEHKPTFLYRNIQKTDDSTVQSSTVMNDSFRIIYAGLLGVAQGIFDIIKNIDFNELGVEFEIYGDGNEKDEIVAFLNKNPNKGITYKGSISNVELRRILPTYQSSIVPLTNRIIGAVPSKIFELMQHEIPVLFCGGGEGAKIVEKYKVGLTIPPGDYDVLKIAIEEIKAMPKSDLLKLKERCRHASMEVFNFESQITKLMEVFNDE